jgi:hypothetical protein
LDCISWVYPEPGAIDYEAIVTDNASSDGSVAAIRERFPGDRVVENSALGPSVTDRLDFANESAGSSLAGTSMERFLLRFVC